MILNEQDLKLDKLIMHNEYLENILKATEQDKKLYKIQAQLQRTLANDLSGGLCLLRMRLEPICDQGRDVKEPGFIHISEEECNTIKTQPKKSLKKIAFKSIKEPNKKQSSAIDDTNKLNNTKELRNIELMKIFKNVTKRLCIFATKVRTEKQVLKQKLPSFILSQQEFQEEKDKKIERENKRILNIPRCRQGLLLPVILIH